MVRVVAVALLCAALGWAQETPAGVVTGTVVDDTTGVAIAAARVGIGRLEGVTTQRFGITAEDGSFRITGVAPGQYWIECSSPGYVKMEGYNLDGPAIDVPAQGIPRPVTVRLVPGASIEGHLVSEDGEPILFATVEVYHGRATPSTTGLLGVFRIDGLPDGDHILRARIDDAIRRDRVRVDPVTMERSGLPQIVFYPGVADVSRATPIHLTRGEQRRDLEFRVKRARLVSAGGTVIDAKTGAPLKGGEIELRPGAKAPPGDGIPRRALKEGTFRFDLLVPGTYQARVYRVPGLGAAPFVINLEAGPSDATDLRIVLPSGGRLCGRITGPRGPTMTSVSLMPAGSSGLSTTPIQADGSFCMDGLAPGKWRVAFLGRPSEEAVMVVSFRQAGRSLPHEVNVVEGDNPPLEIETARQFWVTGRAVDAAGQPVENAIVGFADARGLRANQSGKDGGFRIGIVAGEFVVSAWPKMPPRGMNSCATSQVVRITGDLSGLIVAMCP